MRLIQFLNVYFNLVKFDIELRFLGFEKVFRKYIKSHPALRELNSVKQEEIDKMNDWLRMIDRVCISYPFEAQCLHRSFLAFRFIRRKFDLPVELVIGVKKFPFQAHAWLMFKGRNFNEAPEYTSGFTIILHSSEREAI